MQNPVVSIITPSFNQGQYIEETIKSVLNQTYDNIEYIVVDGGSTDNTLAILEKYQDKIKYISEKDSGQSSAINKGFKMATGQIVGWINSDDLLVNDTVAAVVDAFKNNNRLGLVYGNLTYIDGNNKPVKYYGHQLSRFPNISLNYLLNIKPAVCQPGSFYSLNLVREVGYLDESLHFVMDYDLWLKLLLQSEISYLDKVVANFRLHNESKTILQRNMFALEIYKVIQKYGGSLNVLPSDYLKKNFYDYWCEKLKEKIINLFRESKGKRIGIYGIGGHTQGIFELYAKYIGEIDFNIYYFDSDPQKWGSKYQDGVVNVPKDIPYFNLDKIIISSFAYQEEIYNQIKSYEKLGVKIVKIYQTDDNICFI